MYWIATHYSADADREWFIYLKSDTRPDGMPHPGDSVLLYERAHRASRRGSRSLVGSVRVIGPVRARCPANGAWKYAIPCDPLLPAEHHAHWDEVLKRLSLTANTQAKAWQGLKRISRTQYAKLFAAMHRK